MVLYLQVLFLGRHKMKIGAIWRLPNSVKSYYNDSYNVMQAREQFMDVFIVFD